MTEKIIKNNLPSFLFMIVLFIPVIIYLIDEYRTFEKEKFSFYNEKAKNELKLKKIENKIKILKKDFEKEKVEFSYKNKIEKEIELERINRLLQDNKNLINENENLKHALIEIKKENKEQNLIIINLKKIDKIIELKEKHFEKYSKLTNRNYEKAKNNFMM